jgi:hypothetical protein
LSCLAAVFTLVLVCACTSQVDAQRRARRGGEGQERLRALAQSVEAKRTDGYDTAEAESLLVELNAALRAKQRRTARDLFEVAESALARARRLTPEEIAARNAPAALGWIAPAPGRVDATWPAAVPPLGVSGPFDTSSPSSGLPLVRSLGAGWVRLGAAAGGGLFWGQIEPARGTWAWGHTDSIVAACNAAGLRVLANITPFSRWDAEACGRGRDNYKAFPCDVAAYRAYVHAVAERYRGRIHAYQIVNEPDHDAFWHDTAESYAALVAETAPVIRGADPEALVMLAGINTEDFLRRVLLELTRRSATTRFADAVDVLVLNFAAPRLGRGATSTYRETDALLAMVRRVAAGTPYADLPVYITETSTYDGAPPHLPPQSLTEQARDAVRLLAYPFARGVRAVFWTSLVEWTTWTGNAAKFNSVGLINNPENGGSRTYKPAFFAMQKFASITRGFTSVRVLQAPEWVTAIEFATPRGPVIVAWYDRWALRAPATVRASLEAAHRDVTITTAVPSLATATTTSHAPRFAEQTATTQNGRVTITLGDDPVYVTAR